MIGLSAIWLILLIIYLSCIIYKVVKEEKDIREGIKSSLKYVAVFVVTALVCAGIGYLIGYAIDGSDAASIGGKIGYAIFGFVCLCVCIYGIYCNLKD